MSLPTKWIMPFVLCLATAPVLGASSEQRTPLNDTDIGEALTGNLVSYSPPGWADAGIHEEFHEGGVWRGIYYSRGPRPFTGHWAIRNAQLCVSPDKGAIVAQWFIGDRCRTVWRDRRTGRLFLEHLDPRPYGLEALPLGVKKLKAPSGVR
jgi:hypothetical protein